LINVVRRSPLVTIQTVTARIAELESQRERAVAAAMAQGATWAQIGEALMVSTQAAHKRYRWLRHSSVTGECWYEPPLAGVGRRARR
jgi:hypothetical protein